MTGEERRWPFARLAPDGLHGWALAALYGFTAVAVAGYGIFALHPERLPSTGLAIAVYRSSFQAFAQLHVALSGLVLLVALARGGGVRWAVPFVFAYAVSFTSEFVGTGYGVPFGGYGYTGLLGARLGGRVPFLIPLSWFLMAVPSWLLARRLVGGSARRLGAIVVGTLLMVTWDLALDPAMSFLTRYWVWAEVGPYYGMPLLNLLGWALTGAVLVAGLEWLAPRERLDRLSTRWLAGYWGAVLLMPLGMCAAAGLEGAVAATAAGIALSVGTGLVLRRASDDVPTPARTASGRRRIEVDVREMAS